MNAEHARRSHRGFSLIEVIVSMLILTVGLLGLAAGTGWILRNVEGARVDTARATAVQSSIERVRSVPFVELEEPGSASIPGGYTASWSLLSTTTRSAQMQIVVVGPGRVPGGEGGMPQFSNNVADTVLYRVIR
jgi:prepilin-type N-terminal cleavage/methylation domain-containing protein